MTWKSVNCPAHKDVYASARLNEEDGWIHCHGCGLSEPLQNKKNFTPNTLKEKDMSQRPTPLSKRAAKHLKEAVERYYVDGLGDVELPKYLYSRGLDRADASTFRLGVVRDPVPGHEKYIGRMSIPYITVNGPVSLRFRCMCGNCKQVGHPKYMGLPGQTTRMYGVKTISSSVTQSITITEGEIDALTLIKVGVPAVGIPGAQSWKPHYTRVLEDFQDIRVVGDGDIAGKEFVSTVMSAVQEATPVYMPDGLDTNSVFTEFGKQQLLETIGVAA